MNFFRKYFSYNIFDTFNNFIFYCVNVSLNYELFVHVLAEIEIITIIKHLVHLGELKQTNLKQTNIFAWRQFNISCLLWQLKKKNTTHI